ncbi:hypothetical protein [Ralstonia pseudosolanacearum]|uniref:hypothetical protein n=1 Tax=Ralstonia pseudosolanacearum TaxID=1310165 RepID=UPI003CEB67BB
MLTEPNIDAIADAGHRGLDGGIHPARVYAFSRRLALAFIEHVDAGNRLDDNEIDGIWQQALKAEGLTVPNARRQIVEEILSRHRAFLANAERMPVRLQLDEISGLWVEGSEAAITALKEQIDALRGGVSQNDIDIKRERLDSLPRNTLYTMINCLKLQVLAHERVHSVEKVDQEADAKRWRAVAPLMSVSVMDEDHGDYLALATISTIAFKEPFDMIAGRHQTPEAWADEIQRRAAI